MNSSLLIALYLSPLLLGWLIFEFKRRKLRSQLFPLERGYDSLQKSPPSSLHPKIDLEKCMGSGACVKACPEKTILRVVHGVATLVDPGSCVGHGACVAACPVGAITLVFGSSDKGVEIPALDPQFQSSVPGIFVAGELGGMGLIRNAIEQGRQAITAIAERTNRTSPHLDVVIVGAGPAGLSASLGAKQHALRFVTIEQNTVGGTIAHYPRGKLVMTQTATLPIIGQFRFGEIKREDLMRFWITCLEKGGITVREQEVMTSIELAEGGFLLTTNKVKYYTQNVLLCLGRRGTPRTLDVPGESHSKVIYQLSNASDYIGRRVLVVGGGDSAVEAACSIARENPKSVHLSYRRAEFSGIKSKNQKELQNTVQTGLLNLVLDSKVVEIRQDTVVLDQAGTLISLPNDDVIVCIGGNMPTQLLKQIGLRFDTKFGTA